ncbi:MAG: ATP-binding cassette domain-containing protein, partial [Firmicutes bacterium]|nr:ATP-binding cassette domain-containing protein [Bacillota bacterium]
MDQLAGPAGAGPCLFLTKGGLLLENKTAAVSMRGITKTFGSVVANNNVDLDIYKGEILSLLGENGSGKTTLMNMLSGIYFPDEGQILIDGKPVTSCPMKWGIFGVSCSFLSSTSAMTKPSFSPKNSSTSKVWSPLLTSQRILSMMP